SDSSAFAQALDEHEAEGGAVGRLARYTANRNLLVAGMRAMGFHTLLADRWLSPIIVTFHSPGDPRFDFTTFYRLIKGQGFIIYPGKLTEVESFRMGCIGQLFAEQMQGVLAAVRMALGALGIADGTPRPEDLNCRILRKSPCTFITNAVIVARFRRSSSTGPALLWTSARWPRLRRSRNCLPRRAST
ncbi:MAG: hypothetical protein LM522_02855, partial [Candidatus Contendobacter sp.]|nr:hypothetical protein [Candidatus Contendobacter sp.]